MAEDIKASQGQMPGEWRWASALDREIGSQHIRYIQSQASGLGHSRAIGEIF